MYYIIYLSYIYILFLNLHTYIHRIYIKCVGCGSVRERGYETTKGSIGGQQRLCEIHGHDREVQGVEM